MFVEERLLELCLERAKSGIRTANPAERGVERATTAIYVVRLGTRMDWTRAAPQ